MRRGAIVRVVTIALLAAAVATAVALFIPWLPPLRSEEGERIDFVLWFTVAICIGVFAVVAAISVYSVAKFRVRPDDDSDGPPIHGHTGIEIAWTAIPTILVTVIAVVSAVALAENGKLKDDRVVVEVTARQFAWTFAYPTEAEAVAAAKDEQICKLPPETANCPVSGTLRLPEGRQVELRLTGPRRHPLVLGPRVQAEAGRCARRSSPASRSRRPSPASTASSAPSSAGSATPSCEQG